MASISPLWQHLSYDHEWGIMAQVIAVFNNKGGVSKTTTTFNLSWKLAQMGKRVVVVDADPQCNLTGMVLEAKKDLSLDTFYEEYPGRNIKAALDPAFSSRPVAIQAIECVEVSGIDGLYLVPGHVSFAEDEVSLGMAQQLSDTLQNFRNLPGSFGHLFAKTAEKYEADYVILDLSPGLGAINQNLVATADYILLPASPDVFSVMALQSLAKVLPKWKSWADRASEMDSLKDADYPFTAVGVKLLGIVLQRYRIRNGEPSAAFEEYFTKINEVVASDFAPSLRDANMLFSEEQYAAAGIDPNLRIAEISDFNSLIAFSQRAGKPVFALTQEDVNQQGSVWENSRTAIEKFDGIFNELAKRTIKLTGQHD